MYLNFILYCEQYHCKQSVNYQSAACLSHFFVLTIALYTLLVHLCELGSAGYFSNMCSADHTALALIHDTVCSNIHNMRIPMSQWYTF